jgi:subtilase family serine protease
MSRAKTSLSAVVAAGALVAAALAAAPTASATPKPVRVPRTAPTWVAKAHAIGDAPAGGIATFRVHLAPRGGTAALNAAVAAVSDPSSPSYRKFLSAAQYHAQFDATDAVVDQVSTFLTRNHLTVTSVEPHHRFLSVRGTNASVQKAFAVRLKRFKRQGQIVQANTSAVMVPTDVAPYVASVSGLDTSRHLVKHSVAPPPAGFRNARPCSVSYGQVKAKWQADYKTPLPRFKGKVLPYVVCGYTGPQLRAAYEGDTTLTGAGVTVAITDAYASPTIAADANTYAIRHGDGAYASRQLQQVTPGAYTDEDLCDASGWYGEETLDVEAVHAMAPDAHIRYYASASCFDDDFLTTLNKVVDQNQASIVSNSWSDLEANESSENVVAYERVFQQGALQGISFLFSSGDNGDELANTGIRQADYPASDPWATAVGGTADAIGADGSFLFQTGWGTETYSLSADGTKWVDGGYLYGAGGGSSSLFNRPAYQQGVVPNTYGAGRAVPDVGLDADPQTGMLIGQTQTFPDGVYYDEFRIGGTSLASPLFAGLTALRQQHAGAPLGFLNPSIYRQAGTGAFTDIAGNPPDAGQVRVNFKNSVDGSAGLSYLVRTFNQDSSLAVRPGWDDVTGVGSPRSGWLTSAP